MIGETRNGRSMSASSTAASRPRRRTSTSAHAMPKMGLSGTAMTAMSSDSHSALIAAGVGIHPQATPKPCSKVLVKMRTTGRISSASRYSSATARRDHLARPLMRNATSQSADENEHDQRQQDQHQRQRGRRLRSV